MQFPVWCALSVLACSLPVAQSNISCGEPPSVEFASITSLVLDEYPVGANVTYVCKFGYVNDGVDRISRCVLSQDGETASWTETHISCLPRSCGDPGYVNNGHRVGSLFTFPNFVTYECDDGFKLRGSAKRYCQASGSWSGRLPSCETVSCDVPKDPENGHVSYSSLEYGSELMYRCKEGYQLTNSETVYCTSDGTWSTTDVKCIEAVCDLPFPPKYGSVIISGSETSPRAGTVAIFSCEYGLVPDGPTTSKCLKIGVWTFPPPQCREPCNVPQIPNGIIGRYVPGWRSQVFKKIPVGTEVEDNEKLFLHCSSGYEPLGGENWQAKISCNRGKWSEKLFCEIASCRLNPPSVKNGIVKEMNIKHGGTVYYECLPDFKKVKPGNVTCDRGEWKGVLPICSDNRCSIEQLDFRSLESGSKLFYKNGESFQIVCRQGYSPSTWSKDNRLVCENGKWKGPVSPCIPASCLTAPPFIDHGRANVVSMDHDSTVKYTCESPYVLLGDNKVQCRFGEWSGHPPICKDSSCYLKDLKYRNGVSLEVNSVTNSGEYLKVQCQDGYTQEESVPMCLNGEWFGRSVSPCRESDCIVKRIPNGVIRERIIGPKEWSWSSFRYVRPIKMKYVALGTKPSRSAELFLSCYAGYTFQGNIGLIEGQIGCSYGKWSPDAVCLREGTKYIRTTEAPKIVSHQTKKTTTTTTTTTTTPRSTITRIVTERTSSTTKTFTEAVALDMETTTNVPSEELEEDCSCEYTADDETIVAYLGDKQVKLNDRVQNGSVVKFRCKHVGLQHLVGQQAITCINCQRWSFNDFPTCIDPKHGDAVILYDNVSTTADGVLEVQKGQSLRLICLAMEIAEYPTWSFPERNGVILENERRERKGDILYISNLDIENPTAKNDGVYECVVDTFLPTSIKLRVIDPDTRCPRFLEEEDLSITYDNKETQVGVKATFSCLKQKMKLEGNDTLTCLSNGEWSDSPPKCVDILCKELKGTDLLLVHYTDGQKIGSFATFHCFPPGIRNGVSRAKCLENGQWSHPTAMCRTAPCSMESLFSAIPHGVVPNMEDVNNDTMPYNSTVRVTCEDENMALEGQPLAKCGKDGKWHVESVRCVPGCLPLKKPSDSNLIVMPEKEIYQFGDFITFTCPPGMDLNIELELIMCLRGGWSATEQPECIELSEYDT